MPPDGPGSLIRKFRTQARMTQHDLAEISTVSVRAIRDLENGRVERPRDETIRLIAEAMGLGQSQRLALYAANGGNVRDAAMKLIGDGAPIAPPARITGLTGRDTQATALVEALTRDMNRWITISGLPGVGKTALALEAAHTLYLLHSHSVLWVTFSGESISRDAADRFGLDSAVVASVSRIGEYITDGNVNAERICRLIGHRRTLLVLDGCELAQVPAQRIMALLAGCRGLRILVTTTDSRHIPRDHLFPLAPLDVPADGRELNGTKTTHSSAVRLVYAHIRRLQAGAPTVPEAVIAEVCQALDGIPAALRSGAEWAVLLPPDELLDRSALDPLSLLEPPGTAAPGSCFRAALDGAVRDLDAADSELLRVLAARQNEWTITDVSQMANVGPSEAVKRIRDLLTRGFVRHGVGDGGYAFRVLNLVSHALAAHRSRDCRVLAPGAAALARGVPPSSGFGQVDRAV